jgi:hypothetical protein
MPYLLSLTSPPVETGACHPKPAQAGYLPIQPASAGLISPQASNSFDASIRRSIRAIHSTLHPTLHPEASFDARSFHRTIPPSPPVETGVCHPQTR